MDNPITPCAPHNPPEAQIDRPPANAWPAFLRIPRPSPFQLGGGCRWPIWADDERPTHLYCDAVRLPTRPYCAEHCRAAYPGRQWVSRATRRAAVAAHRHPGRPRMET